MSRAAWLVLGLAGCALSASAWGSAGAVASALALSAWPVRLPVPDAQTWQTSLRLGVYESADAVSVRRLEGDWAAYRPRSGDNAVVQGAQLELAAARRGWELALTSRTEGLLIGSRGAFDLVHAYKRKQIPSAGTSLQVDVQASGLWLSGLRVAHSGGTAGFASPGDDRASGGWRWTLAATGLAVRRAVTAQARGQASFDAGAPDSFSATASRSDTSKSFGGFGNAGARGAGVSLDAGLAWQGRGGLLVNLSAVDLWSRVEIDGAATQTARLSSQTLGTDAQGYLDYRPALTGQNRAASLLARLARKWSLSVEGPLRVPALGLSRVGAQWARMGALNRPTVWWSHPLVAGWTGTLEADPRFDAVGIGLSGPSLALMLRAGIDPERRPRVIGGQVVWRHAR